MAFYVDSCVLTVVQREQARQKQEEEELKKQQEKVVIVVMSSPLVSALFSPQAKNNISNREQVERNVLCKYVCFT